MTMRWVRGVVLTGLAFKAVVLGCWWWGTVALAEKPAPAAAPPPAVATAAPPDAGVADDLFAKSRGFRELLEEMRQRREQLEQREQTVVAREAALKALEAALGDKVARLEGGAAPATATAAAAATTAAPAAPGAEAPAAGACGVVVTKIYQSMKPEEAAPIFDALDAGTALTIFGCMKEKQIGAILAAMKRERAVALTRALTGGA
jgi:flagellar motility protein MotE (MotC chaperone)